MTTTGTHDPYAPDADTSAGRVFTVTGQDWDSVVQGIADSSDSGDDVTRTTSWSTWARSTPRRTASSG